MVWPYVSCRVHLYPHCYFSGGEGNARNSSHLCLYPHCYFSVHEATDKNVNFHSLKQLARQFQKFYPTVYLNSKCYLLGGEATDDTAPQSPPYSLSVSTLLFFRWWSKWCYFSGGEASDDSAISSLPQSVLTYIVIFQVVKQVMLFFRWWSKWWQCHQLFATVCPYLQCYFSGGEASDVIFQVVKQVMTVPSALPHSLSLPTLLFFRQWSDWETLPHSVLTYIVIFQAVKRLRNSSPFCPYLHCYFSGSEATDDTVPETLPHSSIQKFQLWLPSLGKLLSLPQKT